VKGVAFLIQSELPQPPCVVDLTGSVLLCSKRKRGDNIKPHLPEGANEH